MPRADLRTMLPGRLGPQRTRKGYPGNPGNPGGPVSLPEFCHVFKLVKAEGIKTGALPKLLRIIRGLDSLTPDPQFAERFTLQMIVDLASIGTLFNPSVDGHELTLEIRANPQASEILVTRWSSAVDSITGRPFSIGNIYALTGDIGEFLV